MAQHQKIIDEGRTVARVVLDGEREEGHFEEKEEEEEEIVENLPLVGKLGVILNERLAERFVFFDDRSLGFF